MSRSAITLGLGLVFAMDAGPFLIYSVQRFTRRRSCRGYASSKGTCRGAADLIPGHRRPPTASVSARYHDATTAM